MRGTLLPVFICPINLMVDVLLLPASPRPPPFFPPSDEEAEAQRHYATC